MKVLILHLFNAAPFKRLQYALFYPVMFFSSRYEIYVLTEDYM
jgi:hypothetical protein